MKTPPQNGHGLICSFIRYPLCADYQTHHPPLPSSYRDTLYSSLSNSPYPRTTAHPRGAVGYDQRYWLGGDCLRQRTSHTHILDVPAGTPLALSAISNHIPAHALALSIVHTLGCNSCAASVSRNAPYPLVQGSDTQGNYKASMTAAYNSPHPKPPKPFGPYIFATHLLFFSCFSIVPPIRGERFRKFRKFAKFFTLFSPCN